MHLLLLLHTSTAIQHASSVLSSWRNRVMQSERWHDVDKIYLCRNRPHLVILNSNDTYVSVPLLSLGSSTVRSNPSQSTSSHCKINRSSWQNKTQISEKKYEAIINHAYKRSNKTQITFMDKNIDLIINSKFIGSQQTHRKKGYIIWIPKRPLYWESYERGSHLDTNYGPEGLQRTTHASSERH